MGILRKENNERKWWKNEKNEKNEGKQLNNYGMTK